MQQPKGVSMSLLGDISSFISSPLGGLIGDVTSAAFGAQQADVAREFNAAEAQTSRDWQERMANTQYQRTVQDLNMAGLSPMLAYSKGASTLPSGATASSGAMAPVPDFGSTATKNAAAMLQREQLNVAKTQQQVNIASAQKAAADAAKTALEVEQMPTRFYYDLAESGSRINNNNATAGRTNIQARNDANLEAPGTGNPIIRDIKNFGRSAIERFNQLQQDAGSWLNYGKSSLTKGRK